MVPARPPPPVSPWRRPVLLLSGLLLVSGLALTWPRVSPRTASQAPDGPAPSRPGAPGEAPEVKRPAEPPLAPEPWAPGPEETTGTQAEQELDEEALFEGTVVDDTGRPVGGARLSLSGPPLTKRGNTYLGDSRSGEDGRFTLRWRAPGAHTVHLQHPDFLSTELPVTLPDSGTRLVLRSGASVEVEVQDEAGLPLPRSEVYLHDGYRQVRGQTDASGKALLHPIGPGRHAVVAATPEDEPLRTVRGEAEVRGAERHTVRLRFTPGPRLSGVVVDTAGRPVEGVEVRALPLWRVESPVGDRVLSPYASRLYREWTSGSPRPCLSGPEGRFTLTHLTPGPWVVTALRDGFTLDTRATPGPLRDLGTSTGVLAQEGGGEVRLVLTTQPFLRGRVVRADGSPVTRFGLEGDMHEDARGAFRLPIRRDGERVLVFTAPGLATTVRRLQVREGVGVDLGEVVMGTGRAVRLRVVDAEGSKPVAGALVDVHQPLDTQATLDRSLLYPYRKGESLERSSLVRTGPDGTVVLPHLEEQPLEVLVLSADHLTTTVPLGARERELTVTMTRGARLVGLVSVGEEQTGNGMAEVRTEDGRYVADATITEGVFSTLALEAGRYVVRIELLYTKDRVMPSFPAQGVEVPAGRLVPVHFDAPREGADLEVHSAETVGRYLLLPGSWPLPATRERFQAARNAAHGCLTRTEKDQRRCIFELLPAGRYTLLAVRDSRARPLELHREEVVVPPSGTVSLRVQPRWLPGPDMPAD